MKTIPILFGMVALTVAAVFAASYTVGDVAVYTNPGYLQPTNVVTLSNLTTTVLTSDTITVQDLFSETVTADETYSSTLILSNIQPGSLMWVDQNGVLTNATMGYGVNFDTNSGVLTGPMISRFSGTIGPNATTAETTIYTNSIPANALGTNRGVEIVVVGTYVQNAGGSETFTLKVYFGDNTVVYNDATAVFTSSASSSVFRFTANIRNHNSTSSQRETFTLSLGGRGTTATGTGSLDTTPLLSNTTFNGISGTQDSTADIPIGVTITLSAATGSSFLSTRGTMEQK